MPISFKRISKYKVDFIKVMMAGVSILTLVLISNQSSIALTYFVMLQAIIIVMSASLDYGANTFNMDIKIKPLTLSTVSVNRFFYIPLNVVILLAAYVAYNDFLKPAYLPFVILGALGNVYLMRSATIYRRSSKVFESVIYFELSLVLLKFMSVIVLHYFGLDIFLIYLWVCPFLIAVFCSLVNDIYNLEILKPVIFSNRSNISIRFFVISITVALKNQAIGIILPFVSEVNQGLVIIVSRINSVIIIGYSGLIARVPMILKNSVSEERNKILSSIYIKLIFPMSLFIILFPVYIPFVSKIFGFYYEVEYFSLEFMLATFILLSLVQTLNQIVFQSLGKSKYSLFSECLYIFILFIIMFSV